MHHLVTSLLTLTRLEQTSEKQNDKVEFCLSDALLERILPMESIAYKKGTRNDYHYIKKGIASYTIPCK